MCALPAILGAWRQCDRLIVPVPMTPMQKKSTSYLGAFSQPGATLDADASWAMAAALCSPVETVFDLQLRISSPSIPHARECLCCTLPRRSARRSAAGADTSRGSAALIGVQTKTFRAQLRNDEANRVGGTRAGSSKGRLARREIALTLLCESTVLQWSPGLSLLQSGSRSLAAAGLEDVGFPRACWGCRPWLHKRTSTAWSPEKISYSMAASKCDELLPFRITA